MKKTDTIAAIATALGESGIGIIRISGEDAIGIADKIFCGNKSLREVDSHTINYGHVYFGDEIIYRRGYCGNKLPWRYTYFGEGTSCSV